LERLQGDFQTDLVSILETVRHCFGDREYSNGHSLNVMDLLTKLQSPFREACDPKLRIGAGGSPVLGSYRQPDLVRILRSDAVIVKRRKQTDDAFWALSLPLVPGCGIRSRELLPQYTVPALTE